jgi:diaminohydroxyphosphoribosylaminopyrimidine deaminase / 5-amino-6-(5-phosphoribosylamino)uracil reductase
MRRALRLALRARGTTAPNPMVGAVVVREGQVVGEGWTQPPGDAHAEVTALRAAGPRARGATVYVTLEPCSAHGRTPPCTAALISAGVARVVFGASDPNPVMAGGAIQLLNAGIEVVGGCEAQHALDQNPAFFHQFVSDRPFVTLKLARSLDGAIADGSGRGGWLTGVASRREVHRQRADHDAIAVGIGTVLADDPLLTVRGVPTGGPRERVIFDRRMRTPLSSAVVRTAGDAPVTVVASRDDAERRRALEGVGVRVVIAGSLPAQLRALKAAGTTSLYCEGGAAMADALIAEELVDRLVIFTAPVSLGADAVRPLQAGIPGTIERADRFRLVAHRRFGDDLMAIYDLTHRVHRTH